MHPGAPTRRGEAAEMLPTLERRFDRVLRVEQGTAEGGDVLVTPSRVLIGQSARTNADGAKALIGLLAELDLRGEAMTTPPGVLHFKSDCSLMDEETIFSTARLASSGAFEGMRVVLTPAGEEGAANALRINDRVLISDGYPRSAELLTTLGFRVVTLATREIAKIDAGLSCMSLRWRA
jgi:dimethylargininase